jgi:hypothetical protein
MYCSESSRASSISNENAEVFRREPLEAKGGVSMDEKRGKQKRRDRVSKAKTHSSKTKHTKSGGDILAQIKAKENIVAPNNSTQRITICKDNVPALFTQRLGIYNKGKSSLMVSRRRPLHDIQLSQKTIHGTEKDLKRVLGYSGDEKSPVKRSPCSARGRNSPMATGGQQVEEPKQSSSEMELSPPPAQSEDGAEGDSLLCIARRIAEGLHPCMVYSDTDYLHNVKAELRKLMKQGSGGTSGAVQPPDMDTLVAHCPTENPPTNAGAFLLPPASGMTSSDTFFSLPLFEEQGQPTAVTSYDRRMDMLRTSIFEPVSAASHTEAGQPFDLTEVELTTSNFDPSYPPPISVDDTGTAFQMEPPPSPHVLVDPPRDFLDVLDTMQQGGIGENLSRPPGSKWMPTPERPPMFPQKLY